VRRLQLTTTPAFTPLSEEYSMMTTTTQRILDLAAAAPASLGEDLVLLLREANELYQQGLRICIGRMDQPPTGRTSSTFAGDPDLPAISGQLSI
jgi:hypothetical protein